MRKERFGQGSTIEYHLIASSAVLLVDPAKLLEVDPASSPLVTTGSLANR